MPTGDEGLESDYGRYGRIGWRTWLRFRDYQNKAAGFGGLVEERKVGYANASFIHRLFATTDGRRFYEERWEEYPMRYPETEALPPTPLRKEP